MKRGRKPSPDTRASRNIRWVENYCRVPDGRDVGKPVELREWQRLELRRIYDNPAGTRRAGAVSSSEQDEAISTGHADEAGG